MLLLVAVVGCGAAGSEHQTMADAAKAAVASSPAAGGADEKAPAASMNRLAMQTASFAAERQVVRTGDVRMRVPDVDKAVQSIERTLRDLGGYEEGSTSSDATSVTIRARVPVARFSDLVAAVEKLGVRLSKSTQSEDVTEKLVDLDARMRTMTAQEESYRQMLRQARKLSDTITLSDRLMALRGEIESMAAQRKSMASQAATSTLNITLDRDNVVSQPSSDPNWLKEAWAQATTSVSGFARSIAVAGIWVLVFSPFVGIVAIFGWRAYRRSQVATKGVRSSVIRTDAPTAPPIP